MKTQWFTLEHGIYFLVICLAVALRLWNLGGVPLSDVEANQALQAWYLVDSSEPEGFTPIEEPNPAYQALTAFTFTIFGNGDAFARIWPALVGSLMILVPIFFRDALGSVTAILLALLLALDPGLVATSRQAGGEMLGLGFALMAAGMAYKRRIGWTGIFCGLALLAGASALPGLVVIGLAWFLSGKMGLVGEVVENNSIDSEETLHVAGDNWVRWLVFTAGGTIVLVGTIYLTFPEGLSNWAASIPAYLRGWIEPTGVPSLRLLAALVVYQPLGFVFGLIGAVRGWMQSDLLKKGLSWWFALSLAVSMLYPARQVVDLVWVLVPMLSLAALEIGVYLEYDHREGYMSLGLAVLIWLLLTLFWLNLLGLRAVQIGNQETLLRLGVLAGILILGVVITVLIGLGWSWANALRGLVWGVCAAFGLYLISNTFGVLSAPLNGRTELWSAFPLGGDAELFRSTIGDLSEWQTGRTDSLDILATVEAPSMRWELRNYPRAGFAAESQAIKLQGAPSIVITRLTQAEPSLAATYRGQDFSWWRYPDWNGALPPDSVSWLAFRRAPIRQEQIILWARTDIFPAELPETGSEASTPAEIDPKEEALP